MPPSFCRPCACLFFAAISATLLFSCLPRQHEEPNAPPPSVSPAIPVVNTPVAEPQVVPENNLPEGTDSTHCDKHFAVALGGEKPADVEILRCQYWRSAHWSLEHEYYFEIKKNKDFFEDLIYNGDSLRKLAPAELRTKTGGPAWFVKGKPEEYDAYVSKKPSDDFQVYLHRRSKNIFIHGSQY